MPESTRSDPGDTARAGLALTGLSVQEVWLRYFAIGGTSTMGALESYLGGGPGLAGVEHDVLAVALNEYSSEHGLNNPVEYLNPP